MAQLQGRVDRLTKGLTFCEIHRFNKDRLNSIATMLGTLTATHLQVCIHVLNSFWCISFKGFHRTFVFIHDTDGTIDYEQVDGGGSAGWGGGRPL